MSEITERLDAIQKRAADCLTYNFGLRNADMLAHSDVPFLLDLARKQQAALAEVEGWLKNLDAVEEVDPTTATNRNASAGGVASVIRAAVKAALEATP